MPFPFSLPTTSKLPFPQYLRSDSHPSLVLEASIRRNVLRGTLKTHRRLDPQARLSHLSSVIAILEEYLPYLFALDAGLSGRHVAEHELHLDIVKEIQVEWRPCLTAPPSKARPKRAKGSGLDYEMCFVLCTLAFCHALTARNHLRPLYSPSPAAHEPEQRSAAVARARSEILQAHAIHAFAAAKAAGAGASSAALDVSQHGQTALASLALAEAILLAVTKDDPYPPIVMKMRDGSDKEWMFKAPDMPKVRAHLYARLCLRAAELASTAQSLLGNSGSGSDERAADGELVSYISNLRRAARAKACRFLGIDADLGGRTGEAVGWLVASSKELGRPPGASGLSKLKKGWKEKREGKKIERGKGWGADGGCMEEGSIVDLLEGRWTKTNDLVGNQPVPESATLLASLPSGRDMTDIKAYVPPTFDAHELARLRAPLERSKQARSYGPNDSGAAAAAAAEVEEDEMSESDSADEEPPGAFPGGPEASNSSPFY